MHFQWNIFRLLFFLSAGKNSNKKKSNGKKLQLMHSFCTFVGIFLDIYLYSFNER